MQNQNTLNNKNTPTHLERTQFSSRAGWKSVFIIVSIIEMFLFIIGVIESGSIGGESLLLNIILIPIMPFVAYFAYEIAYDIADRKFLDTHYGPNRPRGRAHAPSQDNLFYDDYYNKR